MDIGIGDRIVVAGEEGRGKKNIRSTLISSTLSSDTSFVPLTYTYRSQQHSYVYTRVPIMHTDPPFEHLTLTLTLTLTPNGSPLRTSYVLSSALQPAFIWYPLVDAIPLPQFDEEEGGQLCETPRW